MSEMPTHFRKRSQNTLISTGKSRDKDSKNEASFSVVEAKRYRKFSREGHSGASLEGSKVSPDSI